MRPKTRDLSLNEPRALIKAIPYSVACPYNARNYEPKSSRTPHASREELAITTMSLPREPANRNGFHIAIICALRIESDAVNLLFDEIYERQYGRENGDTNTYTTGRIGNHAVVLLLLPKIGMEAAAAGARSLQSSYVNIKLALLVSVCGALPQIFSRDAFLGDVIISSSIVNYDFGRQFPDKFVVGSKEDIFGQPNNDIRGLLACLQGEYELGRLQKTAVAKLAFLQAKAIEEKRRTKYTPPPDDTDKMFSPNYKHMHHDNDCDDCYAEPNRFCEVASMLSCNDCGCESTFSAPRQNRQQERPIELIPQVFIGCIACGNAVMMSGEHRNAVAKEHNVIAFEMEGAGAWSEVPCIIVKGICDYADSHKHKQWQNFAAATAASVAVAILGRYEVAGSITYGATTIPTQNALLLQSCGGDTRNPVTHSYHHSGSGPNLQGGSFNQSTFNFGDWPLNLPVIHEACFDSGDVQNSPKCESGTRLNIRKTIHQWANDFSSEPVFWLVGPLGTGKSTIARTIADTFSGEKRLVAGYFFKRGEQGRNDTARLFPTLAWQLAQTLPFFKGCLRKSLDGLTGDAVEKKSFQVQFDKLLWHPLGDMPPVDTRQPPKLIIVDALDECERHEHLLQMLALLGKLDDIETIRLRVLITSRPEVVNAFGSLQKAKSIRKLKLLDRELRQDAVKAIEVFIRTRFEDVSLQRNFQQRSWPKPEHLDRLVHLSTNPEPLFIYAATLCRFVCNERPGNNPKRQLKLWLKQCDDNKSQLSQMYEPVLRQLCFERDEAETKQLLRRT